jgi:hypothetical protein
LEHYKVYILNQLNMKKILDDFVSVLLLEIEKKNSWGKNELKNLITETLLQVVMKTLK